MPAHQQTQKTSESGKKIVSSVEQLESMLESWRGHVDEFLVQLDLAHMELRDDLASRREASTALEAKLERRIAAFRLSVADLRQVAADIQQDVSKAVSSARSGRLV